MRTPPPRFLSMTAALIGGACSSSPHTEYGAPRGATQGDITIATYNVNFERITSGTLAAVNALDAKVVFLQETHAEWEALLRSSSHRWPHVQFRHSDIDGGMAVLSDYPVQEVAWTPSPIGAFPAWCLVLDAGDTALKVLAVHLHPPLDNYGLLTGYFTTGGVRGEEAKSHLGCFENTPDLVVGDFNEATGQAITAMYEAGLTPVQQRFPPQEPTWKWELDITTLTGQPDHIFFGPRLQPTGVQVPHLGDSDHWPLRAVFERVP